MKHLFRHGFLIALCAAALVVACGTGEAASAPLVLCGDCGELKGESACCAEDAELCSGCDLHKGSPGCCQIEKGGGDVALCSCGHAKGGDACCDGDAERCGGCDKIKGSPGCCLEA